MDDPTVVLAEYEDEMRLAARKAAYAPSRLEIRMRRPPAISVAER